MRDGGRIAAAIDVLSDVLGRHQPVKVAARDWGKRARYAGSKDRAAIRDHVYDVLRRRNSCEQVGKGLTGRSLMIGLLTLQDQDLDALFAGDGYGPDKLQPAELPSDKPIVGYDLPEWAVPELRQTLGEDFELVEAKLKERAILGYCDL